MKFFFDENFSSYIAKGLQTFETNNPHVEIFSTKDYFGEGVKDEDLIPEISEEEGVLITKDYNIRKTRYLNQLLTDYNLKVFFFKFPDGFNYWQNVEQVVRRWDWIQKTARKSNNGFAFRITNNKNKPEKL